MVAEKGWKGGGRSSQQKCYTPFCPPGSRKLVRSHLCSLNGTSFPVKHHVIVDLSASYPPTQCFWLSRFVDLSAPQVKNFSLLCYMEHLEMFSVVNFPQKKKSTATDTVTDFFNDALLSSDSTLSSPRLVLYQSSGPWLWPVYCGRLHSWLPASLSKWCFRFLGPLFPGGCGKG